MLVELHIAVEAAHRTAAAEEHHIVVEEVAHILAEGDNLVEEGPHTVEGEVARILAEEGTVAADSLVVEVRRIAEEGVAHRLVVEEDSLEEEAHHTAAAEEEVPHNRPAEDKESLPKSARCQTTPQ